MLEWLKRHAWKACSRLKRLTGSNPVLSAKAITEVSSSSLDSTSVICFCTAPPQAERDVGAKRRNPERHSERKAGCRSKATKSGKTTSCPTPIGHLSPFQIAGQAGNDDKGCRQIRQPAAQSKLREPRQRARAAYFVLAMAIYSPDFLAAI